ncbi:L,D-transpeptidase family protein [Lysobacter sp. D1-1-M9]|uniref:L,D-transpeptidase family protein n=1 Tax=Novilysobacter longmucuonensis TaxID=3098603 RepID=UPI002FCA0C72
MPNTPTDRLSLLLTLALLVLAGCAHPRGEPAASPRWAATRQLVLVTVPGWDSAQGTLHRYERDAGAWRELGSSTPVTIGRSGAAWGLGLHDAQADGPVKREGDGRAPAGVFAIGPAFGYAATADTALRYTPMQASHYCIDVSDSPLYNRIVDADEVGDGAVEGSTEPMRRDLHAGGDQRYRLGFVIEHNAVAQAGAGSCIFAHLWKSPDAATAGCTAMDPAAMDALLAWLQPARRPVFVLLPEHEYDRLKDAWHLPR